MRRAAVPIIACLVIGGWAAAYFWSQSPPSKPVADGIKRIGQADSDDELAFFTRAIEQDPRQSQAWYNRGVVRLARQDWAGAAADFTQAIELGSLRWPALALTYRGVARQYQGDYASAIEDHNRALSIDSQEPTAYLNRGAAREVTGDSAGAIADFTRAIELRPTLAEAWANRGLAKLRKGSAEEAEQDFREAIRLKPELKERIERSIKDTELPRKTP